MRLRSVLVALALAAPAAAGPKPEPPPAAKLADTCRDTPCTSRALGHFTAALAKHRAGTLGRPLRISYLGDSLTATDHIAQQLRTRLAALVGDGGPGFVWPQPPHPYCQHRAITRFATGSWTVHGISTAIPADRLLGLGASVAGSGTIRYKTASPITAIDVHYLEQPRGGRLEIVAGGKVVAEVTTAGDAKRSAFHRVAVPETQQIELRARGRVRLFGASLEAASGAVVDNLGVVNGTAKALAKYNQRDHLRNQLAHRASDLVIVMFGTNEAEWLAPKSAGMAEHEALLGELLATIRAANAEASCLVISPLDQLDWRQPDAPPRTSIPAMVEAQRRAATAHGCAFWDVYDWMGGKGSSLAWFRRGLLIKDFQHQTVAGARRIADALFAGLVE